MFAKVCPRRAHFKAVTFQQFLQGGKAKQLPVFEVGGPSGAITQKTRQQPQAIADQLS